MRTITSALFASVLAIVAGSVAGCGDTTDCPGTVAAGASCSTAGLACYANSMPCTCSGSKWVCNALDMAVPDLAVHDMRPTID